MTIPDTTRGKVPLSSSGRRMRGITLRRRILGCLLIGLLPAVALVGLLGWQNVSRVRSEAERLAFALAREFVDEQRHAIAFARMSLALLASDVDVRDAVMPRCQQKFDLAIMHNQFLIDVWVSDAFGRQRCANSGLQQAVDGSGRPEVPAAQRSAMSGIAQYRNRQESGRAVLVVSLLLTNNDGQVAEALGASIDLSRIDRELHSDAYLPGSVVSLIGLDGEVLYRSTSAERRVRRPLPAETAILPGGTDEIVRSGISVADEPTIVAVIRSSDPDVNVQISIPEAVALGSTRQRQITVIGSLLASIALGAFVVYTGLSRHVSIPAQALQRATGRIAVGELAELPEAVVRAPGEIGDLARSIAIMSSKLAQREADLLSARRAVEEKSAHLEMTLQSIAQGVTLIGPDDEIVFFSDRAHELLALPPGIGATATEVIKFQTARGDFGEDFEHLDDAGRRYIANIGKPGTEIPPVFRRKTPSGRILEVTTKHLADGGWVRTFSDITQLATALDEKSLSEERYISIVQRLPVPVWRIDRRNRFVFANQAYSNFFGVSIDELMGKTTADFMPSAYAAKYLSDNERVFNTDQTIRTLDELPTPDGRRFAEVVKMPLHDREGNVVGLQACCWDVTALKQAQEVARTAEDRLSAAIANYGDAVALFDANDRLLVYKGPLQQSDSPVAHLVLPGMTFEELTRAVVKAGLMPDAIGRENAWIEWRLEQHRNPRDPLAIRRLGDRWVRVREDRLPNGDTLMVTADITELKTAQLRAERDHQLLLDAINSLPARFLLFDSAERLVMANDPATQHFQMLGLDL